MARTPPKMAPIKGKCCTVALIYKTKQKTVSFFFFLTLSDTMALAIVELLLRFLKSRCLTPVAR